MSFRSLLFTALLAPVAALAADGDPDGGFAGGGLATRLVTSPFYVVSADTAIDAGGNVLVASTEGVSSGSRATRFVVARFTADGAVDGGYGDAGVARVDFSDGAADYPAYASVIATAPGGKVVVAGRIGSGNDTGIARLLIDGVPDPAFGDAGRVRLALGNGSGNNTVYGLFADAESRTWALVGTVPSHTLVRLAEDGTPDASFGDGGVLTLSAPCCYSPLALAFDAQGRILLAGSANTNAATMAVQRRLADGELDTTFGQGGTIFVPIDANSAVQRVLPTPDGGIVAIGNSASLAGGSSAKGRITAFKLTASGALDTGFGDAGIRIVDFGGEEDGLGFPDLHAVLGADGKVVIARATSQAAAVRVARLLPNGALDATFPGGGKQTLLQSIGGLSFGSVLLAPNRLLLAGAYGTSGGLALYAGAWRDGDGLFRDGLDAAE
jgi:uncharacterized delta-60 repeat protein